MDPISVVIGAVAAFFAAVLFVLLALPVRVNRKRKTEVQKAALSLSNEITEARQELKAYLETIAALETAYNSGDSVIPKQLPQLRLQLDKIKLSQKYISDCAKLSKRAGQFIMPYNQQPVYMSTAVAATMFFNMISLLKTSKVSGFMRSTKMLEEYITQRHSSPVKKGVVDTFAEDYFEENAYSIMATLKGEKAIFEANDPIFDALLRDLDIIVHHSQELF